MLKRREKVFPPLFPLIIKNESALSVNKSLKNYLSITNWCKAAHHGVFEVRKKEIKGFLPPPCFPPPLWPNQECAFCGLWVMLIRGPVLRKNEKQIRYSNLSFFGKRFASHFFICTKNYYILYHVIKDF